MSKLDEIMVESQNRIDNAGEAGWTGGFEYRFYEEWLKGEIKALLLELIGEDETPPDIRLTAEAAEMLGKAVSAPEGRNEFRAELRQKVEEL